MSNEIAKFNEQEMTLIEQLGYKQIPANHLKMFFARAEALGLNPQDPSQIALIERKTKNGKTLHPPSRYRRSTSNSSTYR